MARRKRQFLDDGDDDSDSSNNSDDYAEGADGEGDADLRDELELFKNPYKRRRANGKNSATYGIFADDSEDEGFSGRKKQAAKRSDWAKAPSFVSGDKVDITKTTDDVEEVEDHDPESSEGDSGESEPVSKPPSPRVREAEDENEDERPSFSRGGLGMRDQKINDSTTVPSVSFGRGGIGSQKRAAEPDISQASTVRTTEPTIVEPPIAQPSFGRGGIGSSNKTNNSRMDEESVPTAFGSSRTQRFFVRENSASRPHTPLSTTETLHFKKLESSFGAKMLAKMGWQTGTGLGAEGEGIVTPVESKLRPKNIGIAFKGFKEKTDQSKAEARRRGEVVSDDEGTKRRSKTKSKDPGAVAKDDVWKKPKKRKVKIEHKTYDEIIAEADEGVPQSGVGVIIDATGATMREVSSLADVSMSSWTPSTEDMRIPEVRHNLRLIATACADELNGLAKEAKALADRKKWAAEENLKLRRKIDDEAHLIARLQAVHLVIDDLSAKSKGSLSSDFEPTLDVLSPFIEKLSTEFPQEYERYGLDEVVVASIAPILRQVIVSWRPLDNPTALVKTLKGWKKSLRVQVADAEPGMQVDAYGMVISPINTEQVDKPMTPYESLMWNIWMPKVRTSINNEWNPEDSQPAIKLFEAWKDLLPPFIRDNILDQLILPKMSSAVTNWSPKKSKVSLQSIVFPWLPHLGLRLDHVTDEARRKLKGILRSWSVEDDIPDDLLGWKDIFEPKEWSNLLLKYVLPKLGASLREDFTVNPRKQDMKPLNKVLLWKDILSPAVFGQLLEAEFFPKWLVTLHFWLIQPQANYEEVARWFSHWKDEVFSDDVKKLAASQEGFNSGLRLMHQAMDLGSDAVTKLPKPERKQIQPSTPPVARREARRSRPARTHEITFRSIVEEFVSEHNLFFMPAGKVHEKTRIPLFRVSKGVDGKGGLLVYLSDDAVWAADADSENYRAISLDDMVLKAMRANG